MTRPRSWGARARRADGVLRVRDVEALAREAVARVGTEPVAEVAVDVERWRPPRPGWLGRVRLAQVESIALEPASGGIRVRLRLRSPADPGLVLAAMVRALRPTAVPTMADEITVVPGLPAAAAIVAGWIRDAVLPQESRDRHVRRADTLLASATAECPAVERSRTVLVGPDGWLADGQLRPVWVDPGVHRPVGRRSTGPWTVARAAVDGPAVTLHPAADAGLDRPLVIEGAVDEGAVASLRTIGAVLADRLPPRIAQQFAACGIVVARDPAQLPSATDHGEADLDWQKRSVAVRRHALVEHGPWAALDAWPSVSVVLVTNRPEQVGHAIGQVGRLDYPRLEIVLGLHGDAIADQAVREQLAAVAHPVRLVRIEADATLGHALQRCSDRAEGALVTKMDDDDHYAREHVWDLVLAHAYSGAQIVGKALDWVYLEREDRTVYRPVYAAEKYASFVAGGTMLISRADLAAVGGWRPVPRSVDRALLDRVLADGGLVYRTHGLGYTYVRRAGDRTASVRDEHFRTRTRATYPGLLRDPALGTG